MLALEVHINGKKRCIAGIADDGVVSAILSWVRRGKPKHGLPKQDVSLRVGGLDSKLSEHMDWLLQDLESGDTVLIKVVNVNKVDLPIKGSRRAMAGRREQKAYVRRMAKKFGWKIVTE